MLAFGAEKRSKPRAMTLAGVPHLSSAARFSEGGFHRDPARWRPKPPLIKCVERCSRVGSVPEIAQRVSRVVFQGNRRVQRCLARRVAATPSPRVRPRRAAPAGLCRLIPHSGGTLWCERLAQRSKLSAKMTPPSAAGLPPAQNPPVSWKRPPREGNKASASAWAMVPRTLNCPCRAMPPPPATTLRNTLRDAALLRSASAGVAAMTGAAAQNATITHSACISGNPARCSAAGAARHLRQPCA